MPEDTELQNKFARPQLEPGGQILPAINKFWIADFHRKM
jgi:hypothetical protein